MNQVLRAQRKYLCENEECFQTNISFISQEDLDIHSKNCNLANLDEKIGPPNSLGVNTDSSTLSLLLKAFSESKIVDIPSHNQREIKSLELKQNQIKMAPELF
jgi:hypothetical protein